MKRKVVLMGGLLMIAFIGFSQAVKDRQVIPVAVNLNQVLRMTITNGGNIEFVFNSIDDYRLGLSADVATSLSANASVAEAFYQTDFTVASSTRWSLTYGSEEATFIGTDNPINTLALNNVGFDLDESGAHSFEVAAAAKGTNDANQLFSLPTDNGTQIAGLEDYPALLIEDNDSPTDANAGDAADNSFSILWRCGTTEVGTAPITMAAESLLDQDPSPNPDRYVTNVLFELAVDN
jgi:hypothetical protein